MARHITFTEDQIQEFLEVFEKHGIYLGMPKDEATSKLFSELLYIMSISLTPEQVDLYNKML